MLICRIVDAAEAAQVWGIIDAAEAAHVWGIADVLSCLFDYICISLICKAV